MKREDLFELKERIEEAKTKISKLDGRKSSLMETLKEDYKCKTLKEAKELLTSLDADIEKLDNSIIEGIAELESKYQFDFEENDEE